MAAMQYMPMTPKSFQSGSQSLGMTAREKQQMIQRDILNESRRLETKASILRDGSTRLVATIEAGTVNMHNSINASLREQIKQTATEKARLENRLAEVKAELNRAERTRTMLQDALVDTGRPTMTVSTCMSHRVSRPDAPLVGADQVDESFASEYSRLRDVNGQLRHNMNEITAEIDNLNRIRTKLQQEIRDKELALKLDSECLRLRHQTDRTYRGNKVRVNTP